MKPGERRGRPPRYTIERLLGRGGMASVYLARDDELERPVALKVPAAELSDETFRARFLREARITSRLAHPNVVQVYDIGEDEGGLFIALEHVDGETLADELERRGVLPAAEVAQLGIDVAAALDAAHAAGLVHRDVKPQNIMRTSAGETKLGDFGIARSSDSTLLTEHGTVLGTAAYLAPEQARGEAVTPAADIYGLGVVLYEALTGRLPHEGASLPELLLKREREAPTPVEAHAPSVPAELQAAITQSLAHAPEDRPPSAAAFGRLLALALPGATTRALPSRGVAATRVVAPDRRRTSLTAARRPRRRSLAIPGAILLVALALGIGVWASGGGGQPGPATTRADHTAPVVTTPAKPPPPVVQPTPRPVLSACGGDEGHGGDKGKSNGKGKGKAKGRDKQRERCAEGDGDEGDDD